MTAPNITPRANPDHFGGARVKQKRRTFTLRAGIHAPLEFVLERLSVEDGRERILPVDLTEYGFSPSESEAESEPAPQILVKFAEHIGAEAAEANAEVTDAEAGVVTVTVPESVRNRAGIWLVDFIIVDEDDVSVFSNSCYLCVDRSNSQTACGSMPSQPEIRMYLRDFASENELLDAVDFDPSEIAFAITMCIDEWNETMPMDGPRYTTQNFPYRWNWLGGISARLFQIASEHYFRNAMQYQSGGGAFDDKNRGNVYAQKAILARDEWKQFVSRTKTIASVNAGGYQEIPGVMGGWW